MDQLIIPCAGRGSRFKPFTNLPKPLIPIAGRPMIEWALEGMRVSKKFERVVLIIHQDQLPRPDGGRELEKQLSQSMAKITDDFAVCVQYEPLAGAAHSVLHAYPYIRQDLSVAVWNCDQIAWEWNRDLEPADGWILTFEDPTRNPKWSFVRKDDDGHVLEVAEKKPISQEATIGAYFFARARDLFFGIEEMIHWKEQVNGEYYLAPIYNYLIKNGRKIKTVNVPSFEGLGTPEDLDSFCKYHRLPSWREGGRA